MRRRKSVASAITWFKKRPQDVLIIDAQKGRAISVNLIKRFYEVIPFIAVLVGVARGKLNETRKHLRYGLLEVLSVDMGADEWVLALERLTEKRTLLVKYLMLIDKQQLLVDRVIASNRRLHELERAKSDFLAHVSHELLTPLASMRALVHNMDNGITGKVTPKQKEYLRLMQEGNERLEKDLRKILDISSIDRPATKLHIRRLNIGTVLQSVVKKLRPIASQKDLRLDADGPRRPVFAMADRNGVEDIVANLIENAIKFTPPGGHIDVDVTENKSHVLVGVKDTGVGIEARRLESIFERFEKGSKSGHVVPGVGLGLAIAKRLVELQGGKIGVKSKEQSGSRFYFSLRRT